MTVKTYTNKSNARRALKKAIAGFEPFIVNQQVISANVDSFYGAVELKRAAGNHLFDAMVERGLSVTWGENSACAEPTVSDKVDASQEQTVNQTQEETMNDQVDTKAAEAEAKAAAAAEAKAAKEAEKAAKAAERAAAKAAKEAEKAAKQAERESRVKQNGMVQPRPGTISATLWDIFNKVSAEKGGPAALAEVIGLAQAAGVKDASTRAGYSHWRKFYGITGVIKSQEALDAEAAAAEEKARKAQEREQAKAAKAAEKAAKEQAKAEAAAAKAAAEQAEG